MVRTAALAILALLTACGPSAGERDQASLLDEMGFNDAEKEYGAPIPETLLKCEFKTRSYCISGECRTIEAEAEAPMYVEIDVKAKSYKRCGPKPGDCDAHPITAMATSGDYTNLTVGAGGTMFRHGPGGRFIDIATQAPQTFVSGGKCLPVRA